jgi:hypothetical protein
MENCLRAVPVFRTASRERNLLAKARASIDPRCTKGFQGGFIITVRRQH